MVVDARRHRLQIGEGGGADIGQPAIEPEVDADIVVQTVVTDRKGWATVASRPNEASEKSFCVLTPLNLRPFPAIRIGFIVFLLFRSEPA